MALRMILKDSDPVLFKKCRHVTKFNERLAELLDDMKETLQEANGVGLAAPQVGVLRRAAVVLDTSNPENIKHVEFVNPTIIEAEGEQYGPEGCLSVPGEYGMVRRPNKVLVQAQDRNGNEFIFEAEGLNARICCHELDHLDGILFTELADEFLVDEIEDEE